MNCCGSRIDLIVGRANQTHARGALARLVCLAMLVASGCVARAGSTGNDGWDYGPLLNGRPWPRVPITAYIESESNLWVHPYNAKGFATVQERFDDPDADFATVIIKFPDGRAFKTYNDFVLGPYLSAVYTGDFNNDGIPDFFALKPTGMNGIGGWYFIGVFAFSEGTNYYRFARIRSWGLGPENLVLDPATKNFRLVHTSFRQGKASDGKDHSFWVHRFFKWGGFSFEPDSSRSAVWVQFLNRPNHDPTTLLTPKLKAKLWEEDQRSGPEIGW